MMIEIELKWHYTTLKNKKSSVGSDTRGRIRDSVVNKYFSILEYDFSSGCRLSLLLFAYIDSTMSEAAPTRRGNRGARKDRERERQSRSQQSSSETDGQIAESKPSSGDDAEADDKAAIILRVIR